MYVPYSYVETHVTKTYRTVSHTQQILTVLYSHLVRYVSRKRAGMTFMMYSSVYIIYQHFSNSVFGVITGRKIFTQLATPNARRTSLTFLPGVANGSISSRKKSAEAQAYTHIVAVGVWWCRPVVWSSVCVDCFSAQGPTVCLFNQLSPSRLLAPVSLSFFHCRFVVVSNPS